MRDQLEAFVDGELTGADRLEVIQHIHRCAGCAAVVTELSAVGDTLRELASDQELPIRELGGLAAGVISRTKAEAAMSWQAKLRRASEDGHWLVVVIGSVAATLVCFLALSALLAFGPEPGRRDSLASSLYMPPPGVEVTLDPRVPQDVLLALAEREADSAAEAAAEKEAKETDAVMQLAMAVNSRGLRHTDPASQLIQEALLDEIVRLRLDEPYLVGRPAEESIAVSTVISAHRPLRVFAQ